MPSKSSVMRRRQVHEAFYSFVNPTSTGGKAKLAMLSPEVAALLGLDQADCQTEEFAAVMSGNAQLHGREGYGAFSWLRCAHVIQAVSVMHATAIIAQHAHLAHPCLTPLIEGFLIIDSCMDNIYVAPTAGSSARRPSIG